MQARWCLYGWIVITTPGYALIPPGNIIYPYERKHRCWLNLSLLTCFCYRTPIHSANSTFKCGMSSLLKTHCTVLFLHNRVWAWEQVLFLNPVLNKCWRSLWKLRSLKWCNIFSPVLSLGRVTWLQQGFEVGLQEMSLGAALPLSTHTWSGWPTVNVKNLLQGRCGSGTVWATSERGQNNFLSFFFVLSVLS